MIGWKVHMKIQTKRLFLLNKGEFNYLVYRIPWISFMNTQLLLEVEGGFLVSRPKDIRFGKLCITE